MAFNALPTVLHNPIYVYFNNNIETSITFTGIPIQNAATFVYNGVTYLI